LAYTPDNSLQRVAFFTLAGVDSAQLAGDAIEGRFAHDLKPFFGITGKRVSEEFANWPDDSQGILRFTRRFGPLEESAQPGSDFNFLLRSWRFFQASFRKNWEAFPPRPGRYFAYSSYFGTAGGRGWSFDSNGLTYRAATFLEFLTLSLMACPKERLRKCTKPDCPHPYFVARHLQQNYCSEPCAKWGQSEWKRNWWAKKGKEWRRQQRKAQSRKRR
jgi:hypothetical protein